VKFLLENYGAPTSGENNGVSPVCPRIPPLGPDALHRGQGEENWNGAWRQWIANNPNATREQVLEQLNTMKTEFGVGGKGGEIEEEPPVVIPE
jgi:hypothetical protein